LAGTLFYLDPSVKKMALPAEALAKAGVLSWTILEPFPWILG